MEISERWSLKRVVAQTNATNHRMLNVFRKQGFEFVNEPDSPVVDVEKSL